MNKDITFNIKNFVEDPPGESRAALDVFGSSIIAFLESTDAANIEIINDYNAILIALMAHENGFKRALEHALLSNKETVSSAPFRIEKKEAGPTVENWLKDFIRYHGTDNFSNVVLSKYITRSLNCKNLAEAEKKLVRKLLVLYRNVKFFPESLKDVPVENWEIIPIERLANDTVRSLPLDRPKTEAEKEIDHLKEEEKRYNETSLERAAIEEEITDKNRIESLIAEASKYKAGSLERLVLEEEIGKLERKN